MPLKKPHSTATRQSGSRKKNNGKFGSKRKAIVPTTEYRKEDELVTPKFLTGEEVKKSFPSMRYTNKKWYVYDSSLGYYKQHEENYIGHLVQKQLGDVSSHQIQDTIRRIGWSVHYLGRFHPAIRFDQDCILINVLNGLARVKSNGSHRLEKHNPKWNFNAVLPVNYNLKAVCPVFDHELRVKLPDPLDQRVVLFFGAYCLIPDCRFGITLFNYGDSHTGKSTIIVHGLGSVFGELTSSLKLSEICPENFSGLSHVPVLQDKLFNIGSEIDGREVKDTTNFKRLISGETVMARGAYERGSEILTFCKLGFNMNELPKINGNSAEVERIRLVFFDKITKQDDRDFEIEKQIKLEGDGIFMRLLEQMPEALKTNTFPYGSTSSQDISEMLKEKIDPYQHFMQTYHSELELGPQTEEFEMESTKLDPLIVEFIRSNNYEKIFYLDIFKRRLYSRFNIKGGDQQWRPKGVPRPQQRKVTILHGIRSRPANAVHN